jgi:hypothetical protein
MLPDEHRRLQVLGELPRRSAMKKEKTPKPHLTLKLQLQRETLRALEPPDLAGVVAGVTSFCRSGNTCCNASCNGSC